MDQVAWDDDSTHESNTEGAQRDSHGDQNHANETRILHRIILDVGIEALLFRQLRSSPIMRGGLLRMVLVLECIQLDVSTVRHCVKVCACLVLPTAVFFTPHRLQDENDRVRNGQANMQECQRLVKLRLGQVSRRLGGFGVGQGFFLSRLPPARDRKLAWNIIQVGLY